MNIVVINMVLLIRMISFRFNSISSHHFARNSNTIFKYSFFRVMRCVPLLMRVPRNVMK